MMINPQFLRTFCTLVDVGHFTKTAHQLFMTQSGVSQHIKKLEQQFGKPLINRDGKSFTLTHAGKTLYQSAQPILDGLQSLESGLLEDDPFKGKVSVITPGSIGLAIYPAMLALQAQHQTLIIESRFASNEGIESAVASGEIDIGFTTALTKSSELSCEKIGVEALCLVTPHATSQLSWHALLELGFINHPDGHHHANVLLGNNFSDYQGFQTLPTSGFSNQISLILTPVSMGLGFTVLPINAVNAFPHQHKIKIWEMTHAAEENVYLVKRARYDYPKSVDTVIQCCHAVINKKGR